MPATSDTKERMSDFLEVNEKYQQELNRFYNMLTENQRIQFDSLRLVAQRMSFVAERLAQKDIKIAL